ncbi:hypothetical protein GCM10007978_01230 [Shewanella hanedai]|nr:hypothetical protein GCM10007978_01230 [Shewanella hanedai]
MCKYFYDTAPLSINRKGPYSLYDSFPAVEGHSRIHTRLFIFLIEGILVTLALVAEIIMDYLVI